MIEAIRNFLFPSVDSITNSLTKTVSKLQRHAESKRNAAESAYLSAGIARNAAADLEAKGDDHMDQAQRADRVAVKVGKLLA